MNEILFSVINFFILPHSFISKKIMSVVRLFNCKNFFDKRNKIIFRKIYD